MIELGSISLLEPALAAREADQGPRVEERSLSTAELADCNCPEFCERDHDTD
jgi:hypothetical protein